MISCVGRPKDIPIEGGLTEVEKIIIKLSECGFSFVSHRSYTIDNTIEANVDLVVPLLEIFRCYEGLQFLHDVHLLVTNLFPLCKLASTFPSWCI
jgi:hypothetical protein